MALLRIMLVGVSLFLAACSSSWKAPLSQAADYSAQQPSKKYTYLPGSRYYRVNSGDTLYGIAWETGNEFRNVVRWNNLREPYIIFPGQALLVKPPAKTASSKKRPVSKPATSSPPKASAKSSSSKTASVTDKHQYRSRLNWQWPTKGKVIQSFSYGDATKKGVMLSGNTGQPIVAAETGKVVYSGSGLIGYGRLIIIKHNNTYLSAYGYNQKIYVKEGDWVSKGEKIASMGLSDKGQPGLHFEIRKSGKPVNPAKLLP